MRKEDREVKTPQGIADILDRCDTVRIGICDTDAPYVVPVSFGFERRDGAIAVYFHGAQEGRKAALLDKLPRVCVEADLCHGFVENGRGGYTCDYESVIGYGRVELLEAQEAEKGIRLLLEHCGVRAQACPENVMDITNVYRIVLDEVTGKHRNLCNPNA
ncbi:MAG: pyridoxamine 5'-phosphate oxidase family protein [Clostridiales bacterium]|nr:pyridoxamine 5'-phosphate oxidase family protein [Clostridiales bacterium]